MDSVENIKRNRKRLIIYSIALIILGMLMGILAFYFYNYDHSKENEEATIYNQKIADDKLLIVSEELLNNYSNYFEKILSSQQDIVEFSSSTIGIEANNIEEDIHKYFVKDISMDDIYNYYDLNNTSNNSNDVIKPNYTKYDDKYYLDGLCSSTGNKAIFSNFKLIERTKDKAKLSYKTTIMSIIDDAIIETYEDSILELKYETDRWKISSGTIIGRCGLTYNVK